MSLRGCALRNRGAATAGAKLPLLEVPQGIQRRRVGLDLTNKIALVTGGSRGLGQRIVLAFARSRRRQHHIDSNGIVRKFDQSFVGLAQDARHEQRLHVAMHRLHVAPHAARCLPDGQRKVAVHAAEAALMPVRSWKSSWMLETLWYSAAMAQVTEVNRRRLK